MPAAWLKTYPSLKPLGAWTRDLLQRIEQLGRWIADTYPKVFWLSGFTYPTGFLTAVLQVRTAMHWAPPACVLQCLLWCFLRETGGGSGWACRPH